MAEDPIVIMERTCISGGNLGKRVWVPSELVIKDGVKYIPLHRDDRDLMHFVVTEKGSIYNNFSYNPFFSELTERRNRAVDNLLLDFYQSKDPMGRRPTEVPKQARKTVDPAELASVVTMELPAIGDVAPCSVRALTELVKQRVVAIELTPQNLHYMGVALRQSLDTIGGVGSRKRRQPSVLSIPYKGVVVDYRRKKLRTTWQGDAETAPKHFTKQNQSIGSNRLSMSVLRN